MSWYSGADDFDMDFLRAMEGSRKATHYASRAAVHQATRIAPAGGHSWLQGEPDLGLTRQHLEPVEAQAASPERKPVLDFFRFLWGGS